MKTVDAMELRAAIARCGLTIPKLAERVGMGKKALYQKIKGETQFTRKEISSITKTLHLNTDSMLRIFFADVAS